MAGEIIQANNVEEAVDQLMTIYEQKSIKMRDITRDEYESINKSEREDSDNHLNLDRLGKDTIIVDLAYYKFLENRETAYRIDLIDENKKVKKQLFFVILPKINE
jgi:PHD/YefM family antitoxin component YafN of YafNO toxin-antitoxin module